MRSLDVFRVGWAFRMVGLSEKASRNLQSEWDGVSQRSHKRKLHPTPNVNSGTRFPDAKRPHDVAFNLYMLRIPPHDKPRSNNRASVRAAEHKVHREFRTQRGPLNVAPFACGTVRAGNLIYLRPDWRFSYELAASRYLILVVPGARLGSVSLASVWKCSV